MRPRLGCFSGPTSKSRCTYEEMIKDLNNCAGTFSLRVPGLGGEHCRYRRRRTHWVHATVVRISTRCVEAEKSYLVTSSAGLISDRIGWLQNPRTSSFRRHFVVYEWRITWVVCTIQVVVSVDLLWRLSLDCIARVRYCNQRGDAERMSFWFKSTFMEKSTLGTWMWSAIVIFGTGQGRSTSPSNQFVIPPQGY